jgi:signal peptidase I
LWGYYACHEVMRDDIVFLDYAGNENPLIKIVKGIPGDTFSFNKHDLYINEKLLTNSEGRSYHFDRDAKNLLSIYMHDYNNVIPQDVYLVLGNKPGGSLDSTRFGLVNKIDILGKAVVSKN